MWNRRLFWLASVLGCFAIYVYFNQWAAWVILWWLLVLPIVSLLLSLPAMLTVRFSLECPEQVAAGEEAEVQLQASCKYPLPTLKCRLQLCHCITGEKFTLKPGEKLQTAHCGGQEIRVGQLRIYDYFGLFSKRIKTVQPCLLVVLPKPLELRQLPEPKSDSGAARPKRGGGFSEEHDLRQYTPGDDLRQIHWKLTAKTGKLIIKEPLEQQRIAQALTVVLNGRPQELDRKLGRLLWLSTRLLAQGSGHDVAVLSGRGLERYSVTDQASQQTMLQAVLITPQAAEDAELPASANGPQMLCIGGSADE